jgi:hypothetical protein
VDAAAPPGNVLVPLAKLLLSLATKQHGDATALATEQVTLKVRESKGREHKRDGKHPGAIKVADGQGFELL